MIRSTAVLTLVLALPGLAFADICDDINEVANGWNDVANLINEFGVEAPLTRSEERELSTLMSSLRDGSEALVYLLHNEGDSREQRLGDQLADALDDVYDSGYEGELIDSMDEVVDTMDDVVDYCDRY